MSQSHHPVGFHASAAAQVVEPAGAHTLSDGGRNKPSMDEPLLKSEGFDLVGILSAVDETAYTWDLTTDHIEWESNAATVLRMARIADVETGSAYQMLIAPQHLGRRAEAMGFNVTDPTGRGVSYRVRYKLMTSGPRSDQSIWLEDHGKWWGGSDGQPQRARGVVRVINEQFIEEQRLLFRNDHDELTGQLNRIRLTEALGALIFRSQRGGKPCAFLVAAVNNLGVINETFGFNAGDEVVAATAQVIKQKLRGGDTLGRYSSNKFGIILNDCGPGAMRIAADRFMKAVRDSTIRTSAGQLTPTVSIGGVIISDHATTIDQVLSNALSALEQAKQKRFDCFVPFEPSQARESARQRNVTVSDEVISALDEHRMRLVLQPLVSTKTGKPELYECLLRMQRPDGNVVSAGEFIVIAEQLGLSRLIDRRTLELAVALLKKHPELGLSLNVSSLTANDQDWVAALHRLTGGRREITNRLTIEITETTAIQDIDLTIAFVDTLRELGCKVAIDDFGAGYTSFRNLKLLNVDMVKIDGAFVKDLVDDSSDQVFVRTMVELAQSFGIETVAEWVGNAETAEYLTKAGITYLQGFYFGQPIEAEDLTLSSSSTT